jgi:thiol-disulfide isomerase/thioredoxin
MIKLTSVEQLETLKEGKCILLFSANWCPDCRAIEHFLPEIETLYPEYPLIYVDRDEFIDVCIDLDITGIPSLIVYDQNVKKGSFVSKLRKTKQEIIDFLNQVI